MRVLAPAREHAQQDSNFYLRGEGAGVRLQERALQGGSLAFEKISQHLLCVRE